MKKYIVNLTRTYNATIELEAQNEQSACDIVNDNLESHIANLEFEDLGITIDYADEY